MLPKKYRLPIQDFVTQRAASQRSPYFAVKIFPAVLPYSRFGVVISKKVAALATERNRLKRVLFSALNPKTAPAKDVLIIVQPAISKLANKGAIIEELHKLL